MPQQLTEDTEPLNALYTGEGGTGKTTDLLAMAQYGRVFAVNAEAGIKAGALKRFAAEKGMNIPIGNIEVFPGEGEVLTYDSLLEQYRRIAEALARQPGSYAGVAWDSLTEIQQVFKDHEMAAGVRRATRAGRDRGPFVMDQDNWRTVNEQCRSLIRKFRDLPCHFGMSALLRREVDEVDGAVSYQPGVTPALQSDLMLWADVVVVTFTDEIDGYEEYRGLLRPHGKYRGKDRFKVLPKYLIDPTFNRVVSYIEGRLRSDRDPVQIEARKRREAQRVAEAEAEAEA